MILSKEQLDEVMDEEEQKKEIKRIKEAPDCMVLFKTFNSDREATNVCETLLKLSGCNYHVSLWLSRGIIKWVKVA